MRTSSLFLASLLAMTACCAHRAQVGPSWPLPSVPPEKPYVLALASFQVKTPGAEPEAKAEQERLEKVLATLIGGEVVKLVPAPGEPPVDAKQAVERVQSLGADGIVWGHVSLENGKLTLQRYFHHRSGWEISGTWFPSTFEPADPEQLATHEKEVRSFLQFVLYGVNLGFMLDFQPEQSRRVLEALKPGEDPEDFVTRNEGLIRRRWGMQGRLVRDAKATEDAYRSALAWVEEQRKLHQNDPDYKASSYDAQEALFSVGLARGHLLRGRPQDVVQLLMPLVERRPEDVELRQVLGRALLAFGALERAAQVLEPAVRVGYDAVSARMYAVALAGQPEAAARTREAFSTLFSKRPDAPVFHVFPYLASGGTEVAELKALAASKPTAEWPLPVARFLLGELDEASLWAAAKHPDAKTERENRSWAHYVLGEAALAGVMPGRKGSPDPELARRHFEAAIATHAFSTDAYNLADFQLEQLRRTGR
jgi:tetratricopeptide (TPR) repeat protein